MKATLDRPDHEDVVERAGQAGLVARGVIYLVSAVLTVKIATGGSSEGPGKEGALRATAEQPFGRVLLLLLAIGFAGYALWRFVAALTYETGDDESDAKALGKRAGYVGRGLVYVGAFGTAMSFVLSDSGGKGGGGSGGSGSSESTTRVFDLPMGRWIVLGAGLAFLAAAGYNGYRAASGKYKERWEGIEPAKRKWATVVAGAGLVGHMVVFALVGWFLVKAAVEYDPSEPVGLDGAVRALADEPHGPIVLIGLAIGLVAYAGFSFLEARWRDLLEQ